MEIEQRLAASHPRAIDGSAAGLVERGELEKHRLGQSDGFVVGEANTRVGVRSLFDLGDVHGGDVDAFVPLREGLVEPRGSDVGRMAGEGGR